MKTYSIFGIALILAFLAGKYLFPPSPEIKEKIKVVTVEKIVEKRNVVVRTRTIKQTDGTEVTERTETDRSVIVDNTRSSTEKSKETKGSAKITLGVLAIKDATNFSESTNYGVTVSVPVFGNIKAQALGTTDKRVGLGLALEF